MKDSATDSQFPDSPGQKPLGAAANNPSLDQAATTRDEALEHVRDILLGQYVASQSEKLAALQESLFERLNQHIQSVNQRLQAVEQSMDNHHVAAQQSDAEIREQLKTSIAKANDELTRSQDVVHSQIEQLEKSLTHQAVNKKSVAKLLNDIARKLEDGAP